jgi:endoglucanase Acf2
VADSIKPSMEVYNVSPDNVLPLKLVDIVFVALTVSAFMVVVSMDVAVMFVEVKLENDTSSFVLIPITGPDSFVTRMFLPALTAAVLAES